MRNSRGGWSAGRHALHRSYAPRRTSSADLDGYSHDLGIGTDPARTVSFTSSNGFLTAVPSFATSISYHPNTMVNQVAHTNGVTDTYGKDPNDMARPASISSNNLMRAFAKSGGAWSWSKDYVDRDCLDALAAARGPDQPDPLDPD